MKTKRLGHITKMEMNLGFKDFWPTGINIKSIETKNNDRFTYRSYQTNENDTNHEPDGDNELYWLKEHNLGVTAQCGT